MIDDVRDKSATLPLAFNMMNRIPLDMLTYFPCELGHGTLESASLSHGSASRVKGGRA